MRRLRPVDALTMAFLLFLLALTIIFRDRLPGKGPLIALYSGLLAVQITLVFLKGKVPSLIPDLIFPAVYIVTVFDSLGALVHRINPEDIDPALIKADYLMFGGYPTLMAEGLSSPLLTDIMHLAYGTYYFIPIAYGIALKLKGREAEYQRSLFLIVLCFFLSFIGYILWPALGPRYRLEHLHAGELTGLYLTPYIRGLLDGLEGIKRDAFPSGHTAVALLVLVLSFRYAKGLFLALLPVVALLIFSTVYCRYHYAVDVLGGIGLTGLTLFLGERMYNLQQSKNQHGR